MKINGRHTTLARPKTSGEAFEELYIAVRDKEQRLYTDEQVAALPQIDSSHRYYSEWLIRGRQCTELVAYLKKKSRSLNILEIGCGNGWLSAKMAGIAGIMVTGLDTNSVEIEQARRVFGKINLQFVNDSFNENTFGAERFDVIVFAASLQYFPSVINVLKQALALLRTGGEIHIIDSPFYDPLTVGEAEKRSAAYYAKIGFSAMAANYFHHSISELWGFNYRVLRNPNSLLNRLFRKRLFYWVVIYQ